MDDRLLARALQSERIYFGLAAQERKGNGWVLANVVDLESLPGAGVCILEGAAPTVETLARTMGEIDSAYTSARLSHARLYTGEMDAAERSLLEARGYKARAEIIHAFAPLRIGEKTELTAGWQPVRSNDDWSNKFAIHAQSAIASDGHEATPDQWISLERRKADTGQIEFWLYSRAGLAVATTGLIRLSQDVVRIKNYFVRADFRGNGIGSESLRSLLCLLSLHGAKAAVVLSVEGSIGQRLYRSAGARDIGRIWEWSRPL